MRSVKYLLVPWAAVCVYCVLSLFSGQKGLSAYRQLEAERARQNDNLVSLAAVNSSLADANNSLRYDTDTLRVQARGLGYGEAGERFIRIVGLGSAGRNDPGPGTMLPPEKPKFISDVVIKYSSLSAAAAVFIFLLLFDIFFTFPAASTRRPPRPSAQFL